MRLVAKYALSYKQAQEGELPRTMWEELQDYENAGFSIKHAEDPVRGVLTYEVYEREPNEPAPQAWDSVLAAQLRASLVVENERHRVAGTFVQAALRSEARKRHDEVLRKRRR